MRVLLKTLLAVVVFLLAAVVSSYLFLLFNAGKVITGILSSYTGTKVTYRHYRVSPTLLVKMKEITSGETSIQSLVCRINLSGILSGRLLIDSLELNGPEFHYHREPGFLSAAGARASGSPSALPGMSWVGRVRFTIKQLSIRDGIVHFSDAPDGKPVKLEVKGFFLNAGNVTFPPQNQEIVFEMGCSIPWESSDDLGVLEGRGRVNWAAKNIDAEFKADDIDAVFFYPYYSSWMSLEKTRIEKAKLAFSCDVKGRNNAVAAKCRLELSELSYKPYQEGERPRIREKLAQAMLDVFKGEDDKLVLDFTVHTSLDKPRFGLQNIKSAVEEKIESARPLDKFRPSNAVSLSRTVVQGTFKGISDLSKAIVSGVEGIGKAFRAIFNSCTSKKE